jgi:hypothetical protein
MQFLAWLLARGGASKDLNSQPFLHMHEEEPYSEQRIAKHELDKSAPEHLRNPSPRKFHRALEYLPRRVTPTLTGCNHMEIDNLRLLHGCIGLHMPIHLNTCAFWDREDLEGSWRTKVQTFCLASGTWENWYADPPGDCATYFPWVSFHQGSAGLSPCILWSTSSFCSFDNG